MNSQFYAKKDVDNFLQNKNVLFIITTHTLEFAEYILFSISKRPLIGYYFFLIL